MPPLSINQAAQRIGVSSATLRNWVKAGYITPITTRPMTFSDESVTNLQHELTADSLGKLKSRANKVGLVNHFLPAEYAEHPALISAITHIAAYVKTTRLEIEAVMFLATLRLLEVKGEINISNHNKLFTLDAATSWKRSSVKLAMMAWRSSFEVIHDDAPYRQLYELLTPQMADDFLGLLYQSLFSEGNKSQQGSYYTPSKLVADSLAQIASPVESFLDPCCGSGKYLLMAAQRFNLKPEAIFGFDYDRIAANLARINLLMAYPTEDFTPNIFCMDILATNSPNELDGKIDVIATNPPWGAYKNVSSKNQLSGQVKSGETFAMFLEKSLQLLRPGGRLSFILPESILNIKTHADVRQLILHETKISQIAQLGRQFTGVFTAVIQLDLIKAIPPNNWLISVAQDGKSDYILQTRFKKNAHCTFNIATASHDEALLEKIYAVEHLTLANHAAWALGIVTGNNKKYLFETPLPNMEAIVRGSDIFPYYLGEPTSFVHFTPTAFQQVAPARFFRATEKLIYKFISQKLVFAYDNQQRLTLNSANILIPTIPNMSIKVVLAFLNSAIFQYIFKKTFSTHKILRGDLEKLPFPLISKEIHDTIEHFVEVAILNQKAPPELEAVIFKVFGLNQTDIKNITK